MLEHYDLRSSRIQPGEAHENGVVEQAHFRTKTAVEQALLLRGHADFVDEATYETFVRDVIERKRNTPAARRLAEERNAPAPAAAGARAQLHDVYVRRAALEHHPRGPADLPSPVTVARAHGRGAAASPDGGGPLWRPSHRKDAAAAGRGRSPDRGSFTMCSWRTGCSTDADGDWSARFTLRPRGTIRLWIFEGRQRCAELFRFGWRDSATQDLAEAGVVNLRERRNLALPPKAFDNRHFQDRVQCHVERRLATLDAEDVRRAFSEWTREGISAKTIRNRRWSLGRLFHVLDGPNVETPVDYVDPPPVPRRIINPTSDQTILSVYQNLVAFDHSGRLRDAKTRARFMVRAASGRRPVEVMRAQPERGPGAAPLARPRREGRMVRRALPERHLKEAWRVFIEADAWGMFDTGSQARVLRARWPKESRPYNLRHSLGIGLSERGVDFADVAGWLGHTDVRTTRQTYVPVLGSRMERAGRLLEGRFQGWSSPSGSPQVYKPHGNKGERRRPKAGRKAG